MSVEERTARTHDIMHAVDGWKCDMRCDAAALDRRVRPWTRESMMGGHSSLDSDRPMSSSVVLEDWPLSCAVNEEEATEEMEEAALK
jgi:hypothetical protein